MHVTGRDHLPFGIERVRLLAEADGEGILLGRVEHPTGNLGRLADGDRKNSAGERIERPAMADPRLRLAGFAERALDRRHRLRRPEPDGLVEDDPAADPLAPGAVSSGLLM